MDDKNLRTSLGRLDNDVLLDGFCLLYEEFKEDAKTLESGLPSAVAAEPEIPNFVSLILYLKGKYSFPELDDFTVEGGRVFFKRGGRRIELSHDEEEVITPSAVVKKGDDKPAPRFRHLEMK